MIRTKLAICSIFAAILLSSLLIFLQFDANATKPLSKMPKLANDKINPFEKIKPDNKLNQAKEKILKGHNR